MEGHFPVQLRNIILSMMLIHILLNTLILESECKILRNGKDFFAVFNLVDANSRIKANCIRNITRSTTRKECSYECVKEARCQSFNRHKFKGFCELLAITKFDESGLLQRDPEWAHFETDDDEENVGSNCIKLKPCKPYQICEDTLTTNPWYICRCRDGFKRRRCQVYKGPGSKRTNRAASCRLLMLKYKSIPDGDYWFKGRENAVKCERRVNGGYTPWSLFGPCSRSCGSGTQQRNRTCANPSPKGGGMSCDHIGPKQEARSCSIQNCQVPWKRKVIIENSEEIVQNSLKITLPRLARQFKINMEFKLTSYGLPEGSNIFTLKTRKNGLFIMGLGARGELYGFGVRNETKSVSPAINQKLILNKWISMTIKQTVVADSTYVFQIDMDDNNVVRIEKIIGAERPALNVFVSTDNFLAQPGFVRNFYIEMDEG